MIRGECLAACAALRDAGRTVDLVYIDPPFASGADYAKKIYLRRNPAKAAEAAEAERTLDSGEFAAFEEKMYGDVWEKEKYLNWMYTNLLAIKSVMADDASIYVHLDWHIGHYVKVLMDEIFGEDNFRSEIVWKRSSAHSDNTDYANIHDTIFFYQIGQPVFHTPYIPYTEEYANQYYSKSDERGRFKDTDLSAKGLQGSGYTYTWKGTPGYWRCPISTMERYEKEGRIYYTSNGTPRLKQYLSEMPGIPAQDIWTDIFPVNSQAKEKNDYATQKPEALLERIIKASSNEGMTVADFFGGSGVTAAVAARLGRRFIHVDVGVNSIQTVRDRLLGVFKRRDAETQSCGDDASSSRDGGDAVATSGESSLPLCASALKNVSFSVLEIKDGVSLYRNPVQTMDKLKSLIPGLRNEDSVDEFWEGAIHDSRLGLVPVYLPNLMDSASRILDEPLLFRIIHQAIPELPPEVKKVIVYYVLADDLDALQAFIKEQKTTMVEIELRDLKEVLDDVVVNDEAEWTLEEVPAEDFQRRGAEAQGKGGGASPTAVQGDLFCARAETPAPRWLLTITRFSSDRVRQKIDEYNQRGEANPGKRGFTPIRLSEEGLETLEAVAADCSSASGPFHADRDLRIDKLGRRVVDGRVEGGRDEARPSRCGRDKRDPPGVGGDAPSPWSLTLPAKPLRLRFRNICGDESVVTL